MSYSFAQKKKRDFHGNRNPAWKGGRYRSGSDGFVYILLSPEDSFYSMAGNHSYVNEQRLVMAKHLGRCLQKNEKVIHKNGVKDDNRLENLQLIKLVDRQPEWGSRCQHYETITKDNQEKRRLGKMRRWRDYKKCDRCKQYKKRTEFERSSRSMDGKRAICKTCEGQTGEPNCRTLANDCLLHNDCFTCPFEDCIEGTPEYHRLLKLKLAGSVNQACNLSGGFRPIGGFE